MQNVITTDLSEFGFRELSMAAELLTAYCAAPPDFMSDGVQIMMNKHIGSVFLTDEDFQVAMMNGDRLEQFYSCPECGAEGFAEDMPDNECCQEWLEAA